MFAFAKVTYSRATVAAQVSWMPRGASADQSCRFPCDGPAHEQGHPPPAPSLIRDRLTARPLGGAVRLAARKPPRRLRRPRLRPRPALEPGRGPRPAPAHGRAHGLVRWVAVLTRRGRRRGSFPPGAGRVRSYTSRKRLRRSLARRSAAHTATRGAVGSCERWGSHSIVASFLASSPSRPP